MQTQITKILIIRLSSLGDIVHTYPMLYDIKQHVPNCQIDWLVDDSFASLLELNPQIDNILSIPLRQWKKNKLTFWINFNQWRKQITHIKYNYIIDSQGLIKSAMLSRYFKGVTYGFAKHSIKERLASYFYHTTVEVNKDILAINKNRILAANIFKYSIDIRKINFGMSNKLYPTISLTQKHKYVVFFHATSKNSKKYSIQNWVKLANYIIKHHHFSIVLPYGSANEKQDSLSIQNLISSPSAIVPNSILSYHELSSLIANAEFILGVDTGLVHLANALNKNLIAIYVDTDPNKTGIFKSSIAKNIGAINTIPSYDEITNLFEHILKG